MIFTHWPQSPMSSRPRGGFRSGSLALLLLLTVPTHYCDASNRSRHLFHTHRNKTMQMIGPTKSNNNNNNLIPLPNKSLSTKISHECEWNASTIRARSLSLTHAAVSSRCFIFFFGLMFHNNNKTQLETGMGFDGGGAARRRCANLDKNVNERRQG